MFALQRRPWTVRLVNLVDVLDPQGLFTRLTGMAPEDYYNKRLAKGWTLGLAQELKILQGMIRLGHSKMVQALRQHWMATEPDLVVSLIPNFNRALCESLVGVLPGVPFVTVMTDFADHPPSFWIEPDLPQHVICGTARAVRQAEASGCEAHRVHAVSGMIIHPDFYRSASTDRREDRAALGLDADRPTGLVSFGGHGSIRMLSIAKALDDVQLVLLCGHNRALATRLERLEAKAPRVVVGFTPQVQRYLRVCDFFIGKPGPGSLSEAIQQGLPVVTVRNAWTMPQERYNPEWVVEHGVGRVGSSMRRIRPDVLALIADLDAFRARVRAIDNRAVFEVPDVLAKILGRSAAAVDQPVEIHGDRSRRVT